MLGLYGKVLPSVFIAQTSLLRRSVCTKTSGNTFPYRPRTRLIIRTYYMAEINAARWLVDYRSGKSHLARSGNSSCPLKKFILPARENIVQIKFLRKLKLIMPWTNCDPTKPYNKSLINLVCSVCTGKYCLRFLSHRPRSFVARSVRKPQAILSRTDLALG